MTNDRLPLAELVEKTEDGDFLRSVSESVLQILTDADVNGLIDAGRYERSGERTIWRNGYQAVSEIPCAGGRIAQYAAMALMKRLPKMAANCALAMDHSWGGISHSFSERFKISIF